MSTTSSRLTSKSSRGSTTSLRLNAAEARADAAVAKAKEEFRIKKALAAKAKLREEAATSLARASALDKEIDKIEERDEELSVNLPVESAQDRMRRFIVNDRIEEDLELHDNGLENQYNEDGQTNEIKPVKPCAPTDDAMNMLIRQQIEMAKAIVTSQQKAQLPRRRIKPYNGEATEYNAFIKAFEHEVDSKTESNSERLYYLEQFTIGDVNKLVRSYMYTEGDRGYKEARKAMGKRFGNKYKMTEAYMEKAQSIDEIRSEDASALSNFSLFLLECRNAMEDLNYLSELNHTKNIQMLVAKLPYRLRGRTTTDYIQEEKMRTVTFDDFVEFVEKQSRIANNPVYGSLNSERASKPQREKTQKPPSKGSFSTTKEDVICLYCKETHNLENCIKFDGLSRETKIEFLKQSRGCFGCLRIGHRSKECRQRLECKTCKGAHPTSLHRDPNSNQPPNVGSACSTRGECTLAIVPVQVTARNGSQPIKTYAFFDPGSSISFISDELLHKTGAEGKRAKLSIDTMGNKHTMTTQIIKGLMISRLDGQGKVELPVAYTKNRLPVSSRHIPTNGDIAKWPHLKNITATNIDAGIGLLIGNAVAEAYCPLETITGPPNAPHATRTRLGWLIWNLVREGNDTGQSQPANTTGFS
ncbi:uncharacterized protein [Antedon mediterranea]|uniref:uncharacterized protein n=1 Tax=Antedon mediterranea TaxID=105859 RepID=UPI003AF6C7D5